MIWRLVTDHIISRVTVERQVKISIGINSPAKTILPHALRHQYTISASHMESQSHIRKESRRGNYGIDCMLSA